MYRQSIQNIEVAVLSLDGIILNLNKMRYNYYNRLCKEHNIQLDKEEFHHHLSNMYDMYKSLPLHNIYESGVLNAKIERELFQYLEYSGVEVKEGIYELIEYFHQKNIKVAIIATHHTKNAVEYLKLAKLYKKVHFIVGSDSKCLPLPSSQMLEAIRNHFQVETHHVLVISSFTALQKAANASKMNIIHCDDLVEASQEDKIQCYKCVKNAFEVLNTLLFDKYEEEAMYSSILGMNHSMSKFELNETYKTLNEKYADDQDVLNIVDQTYQYHISQLNEHHIKDASVFKSSPQKFVFDEDVEEDTVEEIQDSKTPVDEAKNEEEQIKDNPVFHVKQLNKEEEDELASLLKQLQKKDKPSQDKKDDLISDIKLDLNTIEEDDETEDSESSKEDNNLFVSFLLELISSMLSSLCILFIGIVIAVILMKQWGTNGIVNMIESIYHIYTSIITTCFTYVLDTLHSLIVSIPSYTQYLNENPVFSPDGVEFFNMFIFNTIIIFVMKIMILCIRRKDNVRED